MTRPVIGIIGNHYILNDDYPVQAVGENNLEAVNDVARCIPVILPSLPAYLSTDDILSKCDGILLTGGRPNVHPSHYGHEETEAHGEFDQNRDQVVLPLIRACVAQGVPLLGICRGFQEMNVAFGGTLHPEIRDLPGRDNHRMPPDGTIEEKFALRHDVTFTPNGPFAKLFGAQKVRTNTLHGQGIDQPGPRVVIDGHAHDGTPEAIYIDGAPGFAIGVQWHPEHRAAEDPVSKPLFSAFGKAAYAYHEAKTGIKLSA